MTNEHRPGQPSEGQQPFGAGKNATHEGLQPEAWSGPPTVGRGADLQVQRLPEDGGPTASSEHPRRHAENSAALPLNDYLREREAFFQARLYADFLCTGMPEEQARSFVSDSFARAKAAWDSEEPATTQTARATIVLPYPNPTVQDLLRDRQTGTS
jgi:hypothetical protein